MLRVFLIQSPPMGVAESVRSCILPAMGTLRRYNWLGILLATALGLLWAFPGRIPRSVLQAMLMTILFLSCLKLRPGDILRDALESWRRTLAVLLTVCLVSPLLLLPFRGLFQSDTYTGLILSGTMSAGLGVIFLSELLGGSPGRALVLAVVSSVLAPFTVPSVVALFAGGEVQIDFAAMSARTAFIVFVPLAAAVPAGRTSAGRWLLKIRRTVSQLLFFTMIVTLVSSVRHIILHDPLHSLLLTVVVTLLSLVCAGLGVLAGRGEKEKMTFAIVASFRNSTLATVLALTLFGEAVALPPVIYVLVGNLMVVGLQLFYPNAVKGGGVSSETVRQ